MNLLSKNNLKIRIWELDFARGISMLFMFVFHYHFVVSILGDLFENATYSDLVVTSNIFFSSGLNKFFLSLVFMFPLMSGITSTFHNTKDQVKPLLKATKFIIISIFISISTLIAAKLFDIPLLFINFGIIHMMASSMLIYAMINIAIICLFTLISKHLKKPKDTTKELNSINKQKIFRFTPLQLTRSIVFGIIGISVVSIGLYFKFPILDSSYTNKFAFLGFINYNFTSGDYFPLIPYSGYFLIGASIGGLIYQKGKSLLPQLQNFVLLKPYTTIGRYAIQFYILHIIVLFSFFFIYFWIKY